MTQTGDVLKTIAFWLLCAAIGWKKEFIAVIAILIYGFGTMLVNVGITKIQEDIEEMKEDEK